MSISIRKATVHDVPAIIGLLSNLYTELGHESDSVDFLNEQLITRILSTGQTEVYLAFDNNLPVGIATLTACQAIYAGGRYGLLDELYIAPAYRSGGNGAAFIKLIKELAAEREWTRVDVTAPEGEEWTRSVDFYKKNGFVFTGPKLKFKL